MLHFTHTLQISRFGTLLLLLLIGLTTTTAQQKLPQKAKETQQTSLRTKVNYNSADYYTTDNQLVPDTKSTATYLLGPQGIQYFTVDRSTAMVKFTDGFGFEQQALLLKNFPRLKPLDKGMVLPSPKVSLIEFQPGLSEAELLVALAELREHPEVIYANPFLRGQDNIICAAQDRLIVKIKPGGFHLLLQAVARFGLSIEKIYEYDQQIYLLRTTASDNDVLQLANQFNETGWFEYAEPDFLQYGQRNHSTNDPYVNQSWPLNNTGNVGSGTPGADISGFEAWTANTGSSSIRVAVIDSGVELNHPDLQANLLPGYDGMNLGSQGGPAYNVHPNNAHGTACAGIVAAVGDNGIGVAGIAYDVKVVPIRYGYILSNGNSINTISSIVNSINWAWDNAGADVISNSWGGGAPSFSIDGAIDNAINFGRGGLGSVVLFAAGNDNAPNISYPSSNWQTVSVGATSNCDERKSPTSCDGESWGGNYGTGVDVSAPGVLVMTTDISGTDGYNSGGSYPNELEYTGFFNGTSAACPYAAGVVALILSEDPTLNVWDARGILEASCSKVGGYTYDANIPGQPAGTWSFALGHGRVNAYAALQLTGGTTDLCVDATPISCDQSIFGFTNGLNQVVPDCQIVLGSSPGTWFSFSGTGDEVTLTTCSNNSNFDTKIGLFTGNCGNLSCESGNDDSDCDDSELLSTITILTEAGEDYLVYVTGYGGEYGDFELTMDCGGGNNTPVLTMNSIIDINPDPVIRNQAASATCSVSNTSDVSFQGEVAIWLYDENGQNGQELETLTGLSLCAGCTFSPDLEFNFTISDPAGDYLVATWYRPLGGDYTQIEDGNFNNVETLTLIDAPQFFLTTNPGDLFFTDGGGNQSVSVNSNCSSWSVNETSSWLNASPSGGSNNGSFTVTAEPNPGTESRTATISVSGCGITELIIVTQEGADIFLTTNPGSLDFVANGGSSSISISSNCSNWNVTGQPIWLNVSPASGSNNGSLTVTAEANPGTQARTATINVSGCGINQSISITQNGASTFLNASPGFLDYSPDGGSSLVSVSSNCVSWSVSGQPGWLNVTPANGGNNGSFNVTCSANPDNTIRSATLTISGCGLNQQISVEQAGAPTNLPWTTQPTGSNHTIILPSNLLVTADGTPLMVGDLIGFFYEDNGQEYCSNFLVWEGQNSSLAVYGNDAEPGQAKNGFAAGEAFRVKVYRFDDETEMHATAQYEPVGTAGIVTHTSNYGTDGISMLSEVVASTSVSLPINLTEGWNMISSYVAPTEADMLALLEPIEGELILLKDQDGQSVIPSLEINNVGNWSAEQGYQVKVNTATLLAIEGSTVPQNTQIPIQEGWQIIAYLRQQAAGIEGQLGGITDNVELVKNNAGQAYIPALGINNIGDMRPTQGYKLKASSATTLVYPTTLTGGQPNSQPARMANAHYLLDPDLNTGNNSTLAFLASGLVDVLSNEDELGIFTPAGILCGAAVFQGENLAITVWGDDPTTEDVEGMAAGEAYQLKAWKSDTETEVELVVIFESGDEFYQEDDLEVIERVDLVSSLQPATGNQLSLEVYPNPATTSFTVELPDQVSKLEIYGPAGRLLRTLWPVQHEKLRVEAGKLPKGSLLLLVTNQQGHRGWRRIILQ